MDRRHGPLRALFTVLAFVLATIAPDRAARERGTPIVESHATSTAAIPAGWTAPVHAVERAGTPRNPHVPQPGLTSRAATFSDAAASAPHLDEALAVRARDGHRFTYDATAPPSIVAP